MPKKWRQWWITSLIEKFPNVYRGISFNHPTAIFEDITLDIQDWNQSINTYMLSDLAIACNKHLLPTVMCPWGCSEFIHKCGNIPFDIVYQRYLHRCCIKLIHHSKLYENALTSREDFIKENKDCSLFNNHWMIKPSIAFVRNKGPFVLTCRNHDKGCKLFMIHTCR